MFLNVHWHPGARDQIDLFSWLYIHGWLRYLIYMFIVAFTFVKCIFVWTQVVNKLLLLDSAAHCQYGTASYSMTATWCGTCNGPMESSTQWPFIYYEGITGHILGLGWTWLLATDYTSVCEVIYGKKVISGERFSRICCENIVCHLLHYSESSDLTTGVSCVFIEQHLYANDKER